MSDNKIVYSNEGIKILVDQNGSNNEVSVLKGVIDETSYEYLEVSGNVEFLNDINVSGKINSSNFNLLPSLTTQVLFNNNGSVNSSADFIWKDQVLEVEGALSASLFLFAGSAVETKDLYVKDQITIDSHPPEHEAIAIDGGSISLYNGNVTATKFYGDLDGKIDITNNIWSHGEYYIPIVAGPGSQTIYRDTGLSFLTLTHTLKAGYFDGNGSLLTDISYNNLSDKPSLLSAAGSSNWIQYNNGSNGLAANSLLYWNTTSGQEGLVSNSTYIGRWTTNSTYAGFYNNNLTKNGTNYALIQSSVGATYLNSASGYDLNLRIGNATKLLVASDGDIGIGTTTTNARLEIKQKSDSVGGGIRLVESSHSSYWDIFLSDTAPDNRLEFAYEGTTKAYIDKTDGSVVASYFKGDGSNLTNINYNNISNAPTSTSPNDSTITINAGTGLTTGGTFTTNQSTNKTITLNIDSSVVRTSTMQTISGLKTFSSLATFTSGFESTTGYCSGDFYAGADVLFVDQSLSRIGINDTTPSYTLDINGTTRINNYLIVGNSSVSSTAIRAPSDNYYDLGNSSYRWDDIWATNGFIQTSDERRKELIEELPYGIEILNKIRPVQYKWKDYDTEEDGRQIERKYKRKHFGIIAQELKATLEEKNISTNDFAPYIYDGDSDSYAVRYGEFIPILIKSVQELSKENNELKTRLEILETLVSSLLK